MANLTLKNLTKKWGSVVGVENSNIEIKDQEFIVFLGPSGCGKTTTMRMIAGLEDPTSGEILIDGKVVNKLEPKDRDIAMVFQNYGLYPHLSVYENIRFPLKVRKIDPPNQKQMVEKAAETVELGNLLNRLPKELSGGQRQRVALARAIVRKPKIFLMDEPLSNLDAKLRVLTRAQLKNLQRKIKTTTVYVTHDQIEAMTMADRVVVMDQGKIQQIGTPKEIYDNPANLFVAGFIGSPPMNIISGTQKKGVFTAESTKITGLVGDHDNVVVGFRAEDSLISEKPLKDKKLTGVIKAPVYNFELLGEATQLSVRIDKKIISAKGDKNFNMEIGKQVYIYLDPKKCCFFSGETGERI